MTDENLDKRRIWSINLSRCSISYHKHCLLGVPAPAVGIIPGQHNELERARWPGQTRAGPDDPGSRVNGEQTRRISRRQQLIGDAAELAWVSIGSLEILSSSLENVIEMPKHIDRRIRVFAIFQSVQEEWDHCFTSCVWYSIFEAMDSKIFIVILAVIS